MSSNKLTPRKRALRSSYPPQASPQSGTFRLSVIADPDSVDATPIAFDRETFLARVEERRTLDACESQARGKPFDPEVLCDLAMSRAETGALAAAEDLVDRAIRMKPDYAFAYVFRATVRMSQERYVAALTDVGRALKIDPRSADAFRVRAQIHLLLDEPKEALTALDLAVRLASRDAEMFKLRAVAREQSGDIQGAVSDAKVALGLEPDDTEARRIHERLRMLLR